MTAAAPPRPPSTLGQAALIGRLDLRRRLRDRSILLQVFLAPILLALIVGGAVGGDTNSYTTTILIADADQTPTSMAITDAIATASEEDGVVFAVREVSGAGAAEDAVLDDGAGAAVVIPAGFSEDVASGGAAQLLVVGGASDDIDRSIAQSVADGIAAAAQSRRVSAATATAASVQFGVPLDEAELQRLLDAPPIIVVQDARFENTFSLMAFFAPGMAMIFLFFVMGAAARSLLTERREGTLDRVLAGPTPPSAVLLGKASAVCALGLLSMLTVYLVTSLAFGVDWGDPVGVLLVMTAAVVAIAGFSLIITGLARSEEQAEALTIIGTLIFAVFGGTFVFAASGLFAQLRVFTPNGQALIAFIELSAGEASWQDVLPHVLILLAMGAVSGLIGLFAIRKGMAR
jgi:ABC-2 type transport system permease protein